MIMCESIHLEAVGRPPKPHDAKQTILRRDETDTERLLIRTVSLMKATAAWWRQRSCTTKTQIS